MRQAEQARRSRRDDGSLLVRAEHGARIASAHGVGEGPRGAPGVGEIERERALCPLLGQDVTAV